MILNQVFENNFKLLLPEFFLATSILTLVVYGSSSYLSKEFNSPLVATSSCLLSFLILLGTGVLVLSTKEVSGIIFNGMFISDILSQNNKTFLLFATIVCLWINVAYTKNYRMNSFEYYLLLLLAVFGLMLLCGSFDIMSLYLALELQSLCLYVLASFSRESAYSTEAGLKYFILGAYSSGLLLLGFSVLYGISGITCFEYLQVFFFLAPDKNLIIQIGILFVSCALFFKIAVAPFHSWSPDIYEGAPLNSTIFFATVPKMAFIIIFLRIFIYCLDVQFHSWQFLLIFCSFLSVILGSFSALKQRKLKRLLAFSSISHVGYLLFAISSFSIQGIHAALFYLVVYTFMSSSIWSFIRCIDFFSTQSRPRTISDFIYLKINPTLSFSGVIFLFSLAGIPPFIGFFVKYCVFLSTIHLSLYIVSICTILLSLLSTFYYIRLIKAIFFEKFYKSAFIRPITKEIAWILSFFSFLLLLLFLNPNFLWLLTYEMAFCLVA